MEVSARGPLKRVTPSLYRKRGVTQAYESGWNKHTKVTVSAEDEAAVTGPAEGTELLRVRGGPRVRTAARAPASSPQPARRGCCVGQTPLGPFSFC